jgi:hypothetical protein
VVRFSRISFQVLFLVSSDLTMPAEVAGTSNLDPSTTSYLHFARGLKIRWSKKNKRTMVFFAGFPQCCHRLVANSPVMDNPNGPTEAGHPKMVTDLKSSFERRDDPDVLKICLI